MPRRTREPRDPKAATVDHPHDWGALAAILFEFVGYAAAFVPRPITPSSGDLPVCEQADRSSNPAESPTRWRWRTSTASEDREVVLAGAPTQLARPLLSELGHETRADVLVGSFVTGPLLLRGTSLVTFVQRRLADLLAESAELRIVQPPFEIPLLLETLTWHPRSTTDPGHRWLCKQIITAAAALPPPP